MAQPMSAPGHSLQIVARGKIALCPQCSGSGRVDAVTESASLTGTDSIEQEVLAFR